MMSHNLQFQHQQHRNNSGSRRGVADYNINTKRSSTHVHSHQQTGRSHYHHTTTPNYYSHHEESNNNSFSPLSLLEYLKVSVIAGDLCCHCDWNNNSEPNEILLRNESMPSTTKKHVSRSKTTSDWTKWMFSLVESSSSSSNQQQQDEKPKQPQHQFAHTSSFPTSTKNSQQSQDKLSHSSHYLARSSSYALKRTGTLSEPPPPPLQCPQSCDEEEGFDVMLKRPLSPCWSPLAQPAELQPKGLKRVSFSSIQIYASTTESLSPSSSLTSNASRDLDSPRDDAVQMSVDAFEANKPADENPIPYHLRFAPPPKMPAKEELRQSDSLLDSKPKRKRWRFFKWKKKTKSNKDTNVPIHVVDATDPTVARHINMAGIVTRSEYTTSYEAKTCIEI